MARLYRIYNPEIESWFRKTEGKWISSDIFATNFEISEVSETINVGKLSGLVFCSSKDKKFTCDEMVEIMSKFMVVPLDDNLVPDFLNAITADDFLMFIV